MSLKIYCINHVHANPYLAGILGCFFCNFWVGIVFCSYVSKHMIYQQNLLQYISFWQTIFFEQKVCAIPQHRHMTVKLSHHKLGKHQLPQARQRCPSWKWNHQTPWQLRMLFATRPLAKQTHFVHGNDQFLVNDHVACPTRLKMFKPKLNTWTQTVDGSTVSSANVLGFPRGETVPAKNGYAVMLV